MIDEKVMALFGSLIRIFHGTDLYSPERVQLLELAFNLALEINQNPELWDEFVKHAGSSDLKKSVMLYFILSIVPDYDSEQHKNLVKVCSQEANPNIRNILKMAFLYLDSIKGNRELFFDCLLSLPRSL